MSKSGLLSALPFIAAPAALATGGLLAPALFGGEAALGAGTAATLAEGGGALPTAEAVLAAPATAAEGVGVATPLSAGALSGFSDAAISGLPDSVSGLGGTAGVAPGVTAGTVPAATQQIGVPLPGSDFTGGAVGANNAFGLPAGSDVSGPVDLGAPAQGGVGAAAPAYNDADISKLLSSDADVFNEETPGFFDKATQALNSPLARAGIAGGGLLAAGLMNRGMPVGSAPLNAAAGTATTNAANLQGMANQNLAAPTTGALPAGASSAIKQATDSAKASVRSKFAGMGLAGSSMEGQELGAVDQQAGTMRLAEAEQLANLGLKEAGLAGSQQTLASEDFRVLMNTRLQQDKALQDALARFSGAFAGSAAASAATG